MALNIKGKNLLTLNDLNKKEINYILELSMNLKKNKQMGITGDNLAGKNIALIFEKPSTRTRCAFAVGAKDEGGMPEYLGKNDIQLGKKESVADTARVLGRMFDGIQYRGYKHETVELLAEHAGVPVWNGLTDSFHPTQVLADFMTIKENFNSLDNIKIVYVGDGRNNVANSLMVGASIMGMDLTIICPDELRPDRKKKKKCKKASEKMGSNIEIINDQVEGVKEADVIYTDVWVSMGEEDKFKERIELLTPYQVDKEMIENTGNNEVIFLHCLPSYHNNKTENGKKIYENYGLKEMEVTEEVFESEYSKVFDQAENRMHTIKAIMVATI